MNQAIRMFIAKGDAVLFLQPQVSLSVKGKIAVGVSGLCFKSSSAPGYGRVSFMATGGKAHLRTFPPVAPEPLPNRMPSIACLSVYLLVVPCLAALVQAKGPQAGLGQGTSQLSAQP
jgi:hypothetical protein